jgi:hypothetical protein
MTNSHSLDAKCHEYTPYELQTVSVAAMLI